MVRRMHCTPRSAHESGWASPFPLPASASTPEPRHTGGVPACEASRRCPITGSRRYPDITSVFRMPWCFDVAMDRCASPGSGPCFCSSLREKIVASGNLPVHSESICSFRAAAQGRSGKGGPGACALLQTAFGIVWRCREVAVPIVNARAVGVRERSVAAPSNSIDLAPTCTAEKCADKEEAVPLHRCKSADQARRFITLPVCKGNQDP